MLRIEMILEKVNDLLKFKARETQLPEILWPCKFALRPFTNCPEPNAKTKKFLEMPFVIFFLTSWQQKWFYGTQRKKRTRLPNKESDSILSESSRETLLWCWTACTSIRGFIWCYAQIKKTIGARRLSHSPLGLLRSVSKTCLKSLVVQRHGKAAGWKNAHGEKGSVSGVFGAARLIAVLSVWEREMLRDASKQTALLQGAQKRADNGSARAAFEMSFTFCARGLIRFRLNEILVSGFTLSPASHCARKVLKRACLCAETKQGDWVRIAMNGQQTKLALGDQRDTLKRRPKEEAWPYSVNNMLNWKASPSWSADIPCISSHATFYGDFPLGDQITRQKMAIVARQFILSTCSI